MIVFGTPAGSFFCFQQPPKNGKVSQQTSALLLSIQSLLVFGQPNSTPLHIARQGNLPEFSQAFGLSHGPASAALPRSVSGRPPGWRVSPRFCSLPSSSGSSGTFVFFLSQLACLAALVSPGPKLSCLFFSRSSPLVRRLSVRSPPYVAPIPLSKVSCRAASALPHPQSLVYPTRSCTENREKTWNARSMGCSHHCVHGGIDKRLSAANRLLSPGVRHGFGLRPIAMCKGSDIASGKQGVFGIL